MEQAEEAFQEDFVEQPLETQSETQQDDEQEVEAQAETPEDVEDTDEEVDYEGTTYRVPKELKDALLRQSDYTQKTQDLAQQRKALEAQQVQFQQAAEMQRLNMQGHAQLAAMQSQLQQYDGVNWAQMSENDPVQAQQAFFQYSQLKDAVGNLSGQLQRQEAEQLQRQQAMLARQLEQGRSELAREIPNWSAQLVQDLNAHGQSYGFSESDMSNIVDPRMVRVLHDAYQYRKSLKQATAKPQVNAKPASKVSGKAKVDKNPQNMSTDEWLAWRNKQLSR